MRDGGSMHCSSLNVRKHEWCSEGNGRASAGRWKTLDGAERQRCCQGQNIFDPFRQRNLTHLGDYGAVVLASAGTRCRMR